MRRLLLSLCLVAIPGFAAADAPTPAARAKALVDAQATALAHTDEAFAATLAPDAVVISPGLESALAKDGLSGFTQGLTGGSPHVDITKTKVKKLTVSGNAQAIVIVAELALSVRGCEPGFGCGRGTDTVHMTELLVEDAGTWKVVAAALQPSTSSDWGSAESLPPIPSATDSGPLTPLLAGPPALLAALGTDKAVSVLGTAKSERAIGLAKAKKLLGAWKKLQLRIDGKPREVRTATYGYAIANVDLVPKAGVPIRLRGLVVALPDGSGAWRVAAAQYVSP